MFGFSKSEKPIATSSEIAEALIDIVRSWPNKSGVALRGQFPDIENIEEVLEEMQFAQCVAADMSLFLAFNESGTADILRSAFAVESADFAGEVACPSVPDGEWMSGRTWLRYGERKKCGDPVANFRLRMDMYGEAIRRAEGRPLQESMAKMLAAFCGILDISFVAYVSEVIFLPMFTTVKGIAAGYEIQG